MPAHARLPRRGEIWMWNLVPKHVLIVLSDAESIFDAGDGDGGDGDPAWSEYFEVDVLTHEGCHQRRQIFKTDAFLEHWTLLERGGDRLP